jgi:pyruvate formate lyase activating enzyme
MNGTVFNIQRFSIHDGPGIRTTVFLKGCSLHCFWCHNPEGICLQPQIQFFAERCINCGACVGACQHGANSVQDGKLQFDRSRCQECGECIDTCYAEARALVGKEMSPAEVFQEILKDRDYYASSAGGVTLSGGEPVLQPEFSGEVLALCKQAGLHTAIETAGNVPWKDLQALLPVVDLILMDLKQMDSARHRAAVGVSNERLLKNAQNLAAQSAIPIQFRIPVIPGVNDSPADVAATASFVRGLAGARAAAGNPGKITLDLLPFHRLAGDKYRSLDQDHRASSLTPPSKEKMEELVHIVRAHGIEIRGK